MIRRLPSVPTTTARDFAAVLFRQRRLLLISFMVILGAILTYGLTLPSYQARMKIFLRRGRVDPVASATPSQAFPSLRQEVSEEELNSEAELLKDEDILRAAVHSAGEDLEGNFWFEKIRGDTDETRTARAMRRISGRLQIDAVRRTNVVEIKYSASDPKRAALVLQCLAQAYLERHQKVRRPSGELNFFEDQVAQSRNGLQDADVRLMDFSRDQGVVSAALERDTHCISWPIPKTTKLKSGYRLRKPYNAFVLWKRNCILCLNG
jgi:polysaccharide biosynthesis transport protein